MSVRGSSLNPKCLHLQGGSWRQTFFVMTKKPYQPHLRLCTDITSFHSRAVAVRWSTEFEPEGMKVAIRQEWIRDCDMKRTRHQAEKIDR